MNISIGKMLKISKKLARIAVVGIGLLEGSSLDAQSISHQSVNSGGAVFGSNSSPSIRFTVGELSVATHHDAFGNSLSGGVVSGISTSISNLGISEAEELDLRIYPNPSADVLKIELREHKGEDFTLALVDSRGQSVYRVRFLNSEGEISVPMSFLTPGVYILEVLYQRNAVLGVYRIVKN